MTRDAETRSALPGTERVDRAAVGVSGNGPAPPHRAPSGSEVPLF